MHDEWTDKLSDYLDDELSPGESAAVESHLAACADCTAIVNDLKRIVAHARSLGARPPQADLWPGIAARTERIRLPQRLTFTVWQAIAASLAIALLSGAAVWQVLGRPQGFRYGNAGTAAASPQNDTQGLRSAPESAASQVDAATVSFADAQYDAAVADLEKALRDGRRRLDKTTIAIVEHNLQLIDEAIGQARQALDADPANDYLSSHLVEARRRKLDLLRRAAELTESN